jgi:hypothetical protein
MTQTWLTQEAADRLRAELAQLEGPGRKRSPQKLKPHAPKVTLRKMVVTTQLVMSKEKWKRAFAS